MRTYTAIFEKVTCSAVQDLFNLAPATSKACEIISLVIEDPSDTTSVALDIALKRLTSTVTNGTGGSSVTPRPALTTDTAAGATCRANDATTRASTTGTSVVLLARGINVLAGLQYVPVPEERLIVLPTESLIVGLETAPASAVVLSATLTFRELG